MDNFFLLLTGMTLWTSVTALFLHLFRRRRKDLRGFSLYGMLAVYLLCFFRSVQLADFNKSMHWDMPDFFNAFYYAIAIKKYDFFGIMVSMGVLLYVLWFCVAFVRVARLLNCYRNLRNTWKDDLYEKIKKNNSFHCGSVGSVCEKAGVNQWGASGQMQTSVLDI